METQAKTKEYIRPIPSNWWMHNRYLMLFMFRELSSVFIAGYCIFLMVLMYKAEPANSDQRSWQAFYFSLGTPFSRLLHMIALAFALLHSITFFNLTPRALVFYKGEEKIPESTIKNAHFIGWGVVSLILLLIALMA